MSNYKVIEQYKRVKRVRRNVSALGVSLIGIGFLGMMLVSGESTLALGKVLLIALGSISALVLGGMITNFMQSVNKEHPLSLKLVAKGDRLCYTISNKRQKARI